MAKARKKDKDEKVYIHKMAESRLDKIGSLSSLDKQWADMPLNLIKNPHKLSEVELYKTLEKVLEMPEKRLKNMLKTNKAIDEVFISNLEQRLPDFLTATLVNIVKAMLLQKDYFREHKLWSLLEE